jgi:uncharacterized protein (DUF433 family)
VIDGLRVTVRHAVTLHRRGETILEIAEALGITEGLGLPRPELLL